MRFLVIVIIVASAIVLAMFNDQNVIGKSYNLIEMTPQNILGIFLVVGIVLSVPYALWKYPKKNPDKD